MSKSTLLNFYVPVTCYYFTFKITSSMWAKLFFYLFIPFFRNGFLRKYNLLKLKETINTGQKLIFEGLLWLKKPNRDIIIDEPDFKIFLAHKFVFLCPLSQFLDVQNCRRILFFEDVLFFFVFEFLLFFFFFWLWFYLTVIEHTIESTCEFVLLGLDSFWFWFFSFVFFFLLGWALFCFFLWIFLYELFHFGRHSLFKHNHNHIFVGKKNGF